MVRTIVGANWGDEGKGKVTDLLAEESDPAFSIKMWSTSSDRAWR